MSKEYNKDMYAINVPNAKIVHQTFCKEVGNEGGF